MNEDRDLLSNKDFSQGQIRKPSRISKTKKPKNIIPIEPTGTPNVPFSEEMLGQNQYKRGLGEAQLTTQFAGTERGQATIRQNQANLNKILSNAPEIKETFGNVLPWNMALKNVFTETFEDSSLTGAFYREFTRARVDPAEALSEEDFKKSPYYRKGMKYPSFPINLAEQQKMADNMDMRAESEAISTLSSPLQKVGRFVASFGAGIVADPLTTIATAFTGVATTTITRAVVVGAMENVIIDEIIDYANKDQLALEGINKTPEERNLERLQAGLFGGVIGGGAKVFSNYLERRKIKKGQQEVPAGETEDLPNSNIQEPETSQPILNVNEFQDYYTTETLQEQISRKRGLTLEDRKELIKFKEEQKRETIKFKQELKRGLNLTLTPEQQADKTQAILQARNMLNETADLNPQKVSEIEKNVNNAYLKTNENTAGAYLPEVLEVKGLSRPNLNVKYKVVDLDSLIYSNSPNGKINPFYPKKYQPRDREKDIIGLQKISNNANNLSTNKLIYNAGSISLGSPIITKDGVVISGNGRSMTLELAYARNKADHYSNELKSKFIQFDYEGINKPVLVREIVDDLSDADLQKLAKGTNIDEVDPYTQIETIKNDASFLEDSDIILLYQGGNVGSKANEPFFNAFFREVPETDLKKYLNSTGLTMDGASKMEKAIVYSAYKNEDLINQMYVLRDDDVSKAVVDALVDVAPKIIELKRLIKQQITDPDFDISQNMAKAFELYYFKDRNLLIQELNQRENIFGEPFTDPITETILRGFFKNEGTFDKIATKKELITFFNNYFESALNTRKLGIINTLENQTSPKDLLDLAKSNKENVVIVQEKPQLENAPDSKQFLEQEFEKNYKDITIWENTRYDKVAQGYKPMTSQVKAKGEAMNLTPDEMIELYKNEANVLNFALFKVRAKDWREAFPQLDKNGKNIRDYATTNELRVLDELQGVNTKLLQDETLTLEDRLNRLTQIADDMLEKLNKESPDGTFRIDMAKRQAELDYVDSILDQPQLKEDYLKVFREEEDLLRRINDYFGCRIKK